MMPLRRHRLAYLSDAGWADVRARVWDTQEQASIDHWAMHRLPLVVTRQPECVDSCGTPIALGLPAPLQWERRRIAIHVPRSAMAWFDEFPRASEVAALLPRAPRSAWRTLERALIDCRAPARVYGSYGWQLLTGLGYVRQGSDIDVWIAVGDADHADAVAHLLERLTPKQPRLDGELVFDDGTAVAWREWCAWRAGRARHLLVKRLHGAAMADTTFLRRLAHDLEVAA